MFCAKSFGILAHAQAHNPEAEVGQNHEILVETCAATPMFSLLARCFRLQQLSVSRREEFPVLRLPPLCTCCSF